MNINWEKAFEPIPDSYPVKLNYTLANLKEEQKMKRTISRSAVLALLVLLLACSALAATSTGLIDYFREMTGLTPDQLAQTSIARDLATIQTDAGVLTVREAVYDGVTLRMVLTSESDVYACYNAVEVAVEGYNILSASASVITTDETELLYTELQLEECDEEQITVSFENTNRTIGGFSLSRTEHQSIHYTISGENQFHVTDVFYESTPFAGYLTVCHTANYIGEAEMAELSDTNAVYYATEHGMFYHIDAECSGMRGATECTIEEALAAGKAACPVCIDDSISAGHEWGFRIDPADGNGVSLIWNGSSARIEGDAQGFAGATITPEEQNCRRLVFVLQNGILPGGDLLLTPVSAAGRTGAPTLLTVIK